MTPHHAYPQEHQFPWNLFLVLRSFGQEYLSLLWYGQAALVLTGQRRRNLLRLPYHASGFLSSPQAAKALGVCVVGGA